MDKVVVVKLMTGDEVVGKELKIWSGGGIKLGDVLCLSYAPDGGVFLEPYLLGADNKELDIGPHAIVTVSLAREKMIDFYSKSLYHISTNQDKNPFFTDDEAKTVN